MECLRLEKGVFITLNKTVNNRSKGLHLSDIINDIEKTLYPQEAERKKGFKSSLWAEIGFMWEEALSMAWRNLLGKRPGEIIKDGIACSPDGECIDEGYIEEYKCTWRSTKTAPWDIWRWIIQTKAYCYVLGVSTVIFYVVYINGDYRENREPTDERFLINYTDAELRDNWSMLVNHAKMRGWL